MKLRRRHLLLAAAPLAGCARPGDGTLRFWAMGREGEVVAELLQDFRAEHPEIRLRIEQLPWSAAHEKLLTAFAGNATPDLAQLGNTWLPEFAALGALEPLAPWLTQAPEITPADHFDGIWRTNLIDGTLYGLPWYVDTRLLFYRRDLLAQAGFDHPPADWVEWQRMLRAIRQRVGPANYAVLLPLNEYDPIVALGLQQDEPLLREQATRGHFRSAGFRRAWDFFLSMYREQLAPPASNQEIANVWNEFGRGYFSFYISGPWQIGEFRRRLPPALQDRWATAPLPGPPGTVGPGASIAGGASLAMFRRSARKPEAWAVMRYLARPEVQQRFHAMTGNLPPRRSAWAGAALASDAPTQAFRAQLEHVRPVPQVPEWERIATEIKLVLEHVVRGTMAPETALAQLDERADRLLEKRRWMLARRGAGA